MCKPNKGSPVVRKSKPPIPNTTATRQPQCGRKEVHMKEVLIKLNEINDVYTLVNTLVGYDGDVDLVSGRYMVDGKSLLGIFSLDLRQPVKMIIHDEDKADELLGKLADMIVE